MYTYISQDKPNRTRQAELDFAKCIALFLMTACHCGMYLLNEETAVTLFFELLGGEFAAPVFMVCMGIGTVFSKNNQPRQLIDRGVRILLAGYLLNIIRGVIPELILSFIDESKSLFGISMCFFVVDILQFAGLALIMLGLFKKWKVEPVYQFMLALLMAGLGDILAEISTGNDLLDAVCALIWGTNKLSLFPLLNWFIYPAAGVLFGEVLMHCSDKTKLYKRLLPIGLLGVAMSYYLLFTDPHYYSHDNYYVMGIKNVIFGLCYPMLLFSVCHFITLKNKLGESRFVAYSSKNLNAIYCISWVVLLWIDYFVLVLNDIQLTYTGFALLMILVFALSYGLCQVWLNVKKANKRRKTA